ncbi:MAG: DNRLRE domain-containing protein, partial [Thermotaleaceae bacterium]
MGTVIVNPQVTTGQISLEMPSKVYGLSKSMFMGRADTLKIYRVLMEFPISMIPEHCTILKATLKIYVQFAGTRILSSFTPYGLQEPWSPLTLNWNNQPSFYSQISGDTLHFGREGFYSFNITKLVSKWYQQEIPNYGLIIKNNEVEKGTLKRIT